MISVIEQKRAEIERLCDRYRVRRLELFGSAARGTFDPATSDLDFLVEFEPLGWEGSSDRYFETTWDIVKKACPRCHASLKRF